jgi:alcohol dehydrogenase class IV
MKKSDVLLVCSAHTKRYSKDWEFDRILVVSHPPTQQTLKFKNTEKNVIAIGGGSVIDTAKILCKNAIIAVPTTYCGASETKHAVYWNKNLKLDYPCPLPRTRLERDYFKTLPKNIEAYSKVDCLCHILEALVSKNATKQSKFNCLKAAKLIREDDWILASLYAGRAIKITGTGLLHGLSYPITTNWKLPHGVALYSILDDALRYKKVSDALSGDLFE